MGRVIILDEQTANQIAAGEAVERPASVVKELIENAIDAGASRIDAEIKSGGIEYVRVADDGEGFYDEDAELAFERHATSKIRFAEDLDGVGTLGFRGEALPSIASVSKTRLVTRRRDAEYGRAIEIHGGRLISSERTARSPGTTVEVSELFFNTPARYKFLKRDSAEAAAVSDIAARLAVGRPEVAIKLKSRGVEILNAPGGGSLADAAYAVLGAKTYDQLFAVDYYEGSYRVDGFFGSPEAARANRNAQFFYINGRHVKNRSLYLAVDEAYRTHIMRGKKPVVILRVFMDPKQVDANAHPAKTEVRFTNDAELFRVVLHALKSAFGDSIPSVGGARTRVDAAAVGEASDSSSRALSRAGSASVATADASASATAETASASADAMTAYGAAAAAVGEAPPREATVADGGVSAQSKPIARSQTVKTIDMALPRAPLSYGREPGASSQYRFMESVAAPSLERQAERRFEPPSTRGHAEGEPIKIAGQVFKAYIIAERGDSLYLIDQHAVHERMLYERLLESVESGGSPPCQLLVEPVSVDLLPKEAQAASAASDLLRAAGFSFDDFGGGSVLLRGIPAYGDRSDASAFFLEAIEEATFWIMRRGADAASQKPGALSSRDEALYGIACKAALKTGKRLCAEEMETIARDAFALPEPRTCPHGRPLIIEMTKRDIDKRFKRL